MRFVIVVPTSEGFLRLETVSLHFSESMRADAYSPLGLVLLFYGPASEMSRDDDGVEVHGHDQNMQPMHKTVDFIGGVVQMREPTSHLNLN
jgi:hypothetical protein